MIFVHSKVAVDAEVENGGISSFRQSVESVATHDVSSEDRFGQDFVNSTHETKVLKF
jgi:hypothetical protein